MSNWNSNSSSAAGRSLPDPEAPTIVEAVLIRALVHPPAIAVPESFAARVVAQLPAAQPRSRPAWGSFSRGIAVGSGVLLTVALFAFAPHATPSFLDLRFDIELIFLAELGSVAYLVTRFNTED